MVTPPGPAEPAPAGPAPAGRKAVFLDRDGVVVMPEFRNGRSYAPTTLDAYRIYDGAADALARLKAAGYALVVVSNQPDVGHGIIPVATLDEMGRRLAEALPIDAIKVCTHTQAQDCHCRKPRAGMLLEATAELGLDLSASFMIGDRASDIEAGETAGCRTVFIDLRYTERRPAAPTFTVASLAEAVDAILGFQPRLSEAAR